MPCVIAIIEGLDVASSVAAPNGTWRHADEGDCAEPCESAASRIEPSTAAGLKPTLTEELELLIVCDPSALFVTDELDDCATGTFTPGNCAAAARNPRKLR